jgi:L-alanine-DL-glutamate epimerase-like enolase superfamily enzyme
VKITDIRVRPYEHDLSRRLGDVNAPDGFGRVSMVAVFIDTDQELTGQSVGSAALLAVLPLLRECLIGEDPRSVRGLWQRMVDLAFKGGNVGMIGDGISSLDCALWDLRAKANGVPLWKELGATRNRVKAYASGLDTPLDDDALREFYTRMAGLGITAGKLKVGLNQDDDLRRLSIVQDALRVNDARPGLMIDSNEYWSPKQAIRRIREFEQSFDLVWAEEPAQRWDYRGLREVKRSVSAAVATGENLDNVHQYVPLIEQEAVDVVQIGWGTSGITGMLKVAELAYAFDLPVSLMNSPGNFTAHVAAVLPHHSMMEVLHAGRGAPFDIDNRIEDGWIVLGEAPGIGLTFGDAKLDEFAPGVGRGDTIAASYRRGAEAGVHEGTKRPFERD